MGLWEVVGAAFSFTDVALKVAIVLLSFSSVPLQANLMDCTRLLNMLTETGFIDPVIFKGKYFLTCFNIFYTHIASKVVLMCFSCVQFQAKWTTPVAA